jgi:hypothetical protein
MKRNADLYIALSVVVSFIGYAIYKERKASGKLVKTLSLATRTNSITFTQSDLDRAIRIARLAETSGNNAVPATDMQWVKSIMTVIVAKANAGTPLTNIENQISKVL